MAEMKASRLKVYIAQPMQGLSEEEIEYMRERAENAIMTRKHYRAEIEFVNLYHPEWYDIPPLAALAKSLERLAEADVAYFIPGWRDSRGCKIEWECCEAYGIPHAELD